MDHSKNAAEIFNKWAKEYQEKFMDVNAYAETFNFFCDAIKKQNAQILDLACGPGNITQYLLSKRPDFKILGTDLASNMLDLAKLNNPNAQFEIMDARDIGKHNKKYDALMCGFCLPYLSKEEAVQLIQDASNILDTDGLIYISTMEDEYSKSGFKKGSKGDEIFMYFHHADYLSDALTNNGFEILNLRRIKSELTNGDVVVDLVLIAKNKNQ